MSMSSILPLLLAAASQASSATFDYAMRLHRSGDPAQAANAFQAYLALPQTDPEQAEWATYHLGEALERLRMPQAAFEMYFTVAKRRAEPETIPLALRGMERLLFRIAVDEDALLKEL